MYWKTKLAHAQRPVWCCSHAVDEAQVVSERPRANIVRPGRHGGSPTVGVVMPGNAVHAR